MGKSFYSIAVYDIAGGEKMSVKLVVGILLLVSILLIGTAQAPKVVVVYGKDAGPVQANNQKIIDALDKDATGTEQAFAFDIDDIDSPDVQSVQATTDYAAQLAAPFVPGGAIVSAEKLKTEIVNEGFVIFVPQ